MQTPRTFAVALFACLILQACDSSSGNSEQANSQGLGRFDLSTTSTYQVVGNQIHVRQVTGPARSPNQCVRTGVLLGEPVSDTSTRNYRLTGNRLVMFDTVDLDGAGNRASLIQIYSRVSGTGSDLEGNWQRVGDSIAPVNGSDTSNAYKMNVTAYGVWLENLIRTGGTITANFHSGTVEMTIHVESWGGWMAANESGWDESEPSYGQISYVALSPASYSVTGGITHETVTLTLVANPVLDPMKGDLRISSSDPSRVPYVLYADPQDSTQCRTDGFWYDRFVTSNLVLASTGIRPAGGAGVAMVFRSRLP